jgi:hypothetical protein
LGQDIADKSDALETSDAMEERVNLVLEGERRWNERQGQSVDMAELCRKYLGERFRDADHGLTAIEEKSR